MVGIFNFYRFLPAILFTEFYFGFRVRSVLFYIVLLRPASEFVRKVNYIYI